MEFENHSKWCSHHVVDSKSTKTDSKTTSTISKPTIKYQTANNEKQPNLSTTNTSFNETAKLNK